MINANPAQIPVGTSDLSAHHRVVNRLAYYIALQLHVYGCGRDLVPLIGRGDEADNLQALARWIDRQLGDSHSNDMAMLIDQLSRILVAEIIEAAPLEGRTAAPS